MLDAISDFWKPSRKNDDSNQVNADMIKPGTVIGFGFIPQPELSGRRIEVKSINTYIFEEDRMTSFVLGVESNDVVSLIIADSDQEKYIAISRKIPFAERAKLFDNNALLACMDGDEKTRLNIKSNSDWANWTAGEYKKAIGGLKGRVASGDYRGFSTLPDSIDPKNFTYTLLVSNNNEFALEIEQYQDNKMEVYATVYRRLADIGEIDSSNTDEASIELEKKVPPMVAKTASQLAALKPANDKEAVKEKAPALESEGMPLIGAVATSTNEPRVESNESTNLINDARDKSAQKIERLRMEFSRDENVSSGPQLSTEASEEKVLASLPEDIEPVKEAVPDLNPLIAETPKKAIPELVPESPKAAEPEPAPEPIKVEQPIEEAKEEEPPQAFEPPQEEPTPAEPQQEAGEVEEPTVSLLGDHQPPQEQKEQTMATFNATINGNNEPKPTEAFTARAIAPQPQEVENDTVECELPAANRVIEEAIRNEMSMSDVVRRIIALPVARQEAVSIPVMLTDADYSLLAVRYGIPAADRAAIKAKIMEEIGDFSGK